MFDRTYMLTRRRIVLVAGIVLLAGGSYAMLALPLSTRQGMNYRVTTRSIPAYVKVLDFVQRHHHYRLLASTICAGKASQVDCALAIFDWTHRNIPPTPDGWPVVDDHVLNIVIRGHGKSDQIGDVFATLSTYAGLPAFYREIKTERGEAALVLAFARLGGEWVPFDVERHVAFRRGDGRLASIDELVANPEIADASGRGILPGGLQYSDVIRRETLVPFVVPEPLRADLQRPWPRLKYEVQRVAGWH